MLFPRVFLLCSLVALSLVNVVHASIDGCQAQVEYLIEIQKTKNLTYLEFMIDATGKSVNDLGKWDQCRDLGADVAHYCTIRYAFPGLLTAPALGVCLPSNCSAMDITNITQEYLKIFPMYNASIVPPTKTSILISNLYIKFMELIKYQESAKEYHFYCNGDTPSVGTSAGGIVVIIFSFLVAIIVIFGTLLDGYDANWWPEPDASSTTPIGGGIQDEAEVKPLLHKTTQRKSKLFEFFAAFSLARNFKSLVGPSPPALAFLNGMRAISITWVILGHSLDYMNYAGVLNFVHVITKDVQQGAAQVFPAAEFSVDSFFWLSGFLVTYLTVQELKTKKRVNWFLYYFHRIWRLSPAYFYALFFYMCVSVYLSDGPMWGRYMESVDLTCGKYWWTNILYVNNFIPHKWNGQCFLWGWYLAVDMQLYIVAPIVFLAYYYKRVVGWAIVLALIVATTVINGVLAHVHHFQWNSTNPQEYMSLVYGKPYTRAAPWLLGIACAFLYLEKKQLNRVVVYVGWAISGAVMLLCVYGPSGQFKDGPNPLSAPINTWTSSDNFMYFTFAKLGWSLALSFLMYSMAMGWGGFVRRFLGASFWNPLARLTYSTYLFHPIIMFVVYYSHLQYFSYDPFYMAILFVGIMFLSFCTAAVIFLTIERPMTNMEKLIIPHKKH